MNNIHDREISRRRWTERTRTAHSTQRMHSDFAGVLTQNRREAPLLVRKWHISAENNTDSVASQHRMK